MAVKKHYKSAFIPAGLCDYVRKHEGCENLPDTVISDIVNAQFDFVADKISDFEPLSMCLPEIGIFKLDTWRKDKYYSNKIVYMQSDAYKEKVARREAKREALAKKCNGEQNGEQN